MRTALFWLLPWTLFSCVSIQPTILEDEDTGDKMYFTDIFPIEELTEQGHDANPHSGELYVQFFFYRPEGGKQEGHIAIHADENLEGTQAVLYLLQKGKKRRSLASQPAVYQVVNGRAYTEWIFPHLRLSDLNHWSEKAPVKVLFGLRRKGEKPLSYGYFSVPTQLALKHLRDEVLGKKQPAQPRSIAKERLDSEPEPTPQKAPKHRKRSKRHN